MGKSRSASLLGEARLYAPMVLAAASISALVLVILRVPDYVIMLSFLTRILQSIDVGRHADLAFFIRTQEGLVQSLTGQLLGRTDWIPFDVHHRGLLPDARMRTMFVASALDVSVVVPTWNEEKHLPGCLKSLADQDYDGRYEVIVVDGGSRDRTVDIAETYADRVLACAKRPVGAARNEGARTARGRIVAFIDADTMASRHWLTAIEQGFNGENVVGLTGPTLPWGGGLVDTITYRMWTIYLQRILLSMGMPHVIGFNCAYNRSLFLKVGGFDETNVMSEDIKLALKMRKFGRIAFSKRMSALTSPRRFHKYGHVYIAGLYAINGFSTLLLDKSSRYYPPVRDAS